MTHVTMDLVRRALAAPRPGRSAQERMVPRPRPGDILPPPPEDPVREAGVLLLLYLTVQDLHFVLTRRTDTVATHKGQISLPGGMREPGETLEGTAVRETGEELGVDPTHIQLLGAPLTPLFIPVSGFWVTPFVGFCQDEPTFYAAPAEVIEVLQPSVEVLLDDALVQHEQWEIRGERVQVPFFNIQGHKVWGATAMMLSEFSAMLRAQLET
ncbi:MAG: CoA pyrophosphatase [Anaerolineae bacterium]